MVLGSEPGWVSLDVQGAVNQWFLNQHEPMALMIKVEDDRENPLVAKLALQPLNCSNGETHIVELFYIIFTCLFRHIFPDLENVIRTNSYDGRWRPTEPSEHESRQPTSD